MGPFGIDYAYMYECSSSSVVPWVVILYFIWIIYLISLLAQTASNYLSPTLSKICEKLSIAYDVAGVTFLAFGNGAPDFFSLIASFSGGVDILVGVGALLGGSMFVCTVVVGSIAILSPCEVSKRIFLRDISFHLVAVISVTVIALIGRVYLPMVIVLYGMYIAYVLMVVISSSRDAANHAQQLAQQRYLKKKKKTISVEEMEVQTAFWHIDSTTASKYASTSSAAHSSISMKRAIPTAAGAHNSAASSLSSASSSSSTPFATPSTGTSAGSSTAGGYSFLLLSTNEEMKGRQDDDDDEESLKHQSTNAHESNAGDKADDDDKDSKNAFYHKRSITISGGAPLDWDRIVVENYYAPDANRFLSSSSNGNRQHVMVGEESAGGINARVSFQRPSNSILAPPRTQRSKATTFTIGGVDDEEEDRCINDSEHRRFLSSSRSDNFSGDHGEGLRLIDFSDSNNKTKQSKPSSKSFLSGGEGLEASLLAGNGEMDEGDDNEDEEDVLADAANEFEFTDSPAANASGNPYGYYDYRRLLPRSDGPNAWKLQTMYGSSVLTAMYWQQWTLRRSLRHRLIDDWYRARTVWEKALVIIEAPASLARDVTIPTLEDGQWSKMIAMMHPIAAPVFALWIFGFFSSSTPAPSPSVSSPSSSTSAAVAVASAAVNRSRQLIELLPQELGLRSGLASISSMLPVGATSFMSKMSRMKVTSMVSAVVSAAVSVTTSASSADSVHAASSTAESEPSLSGFEVFLLIVLSAGASLFIFLSTNTSRPPHSSMFAGVWALSAFVMCILWIYALAGELITILSVLGNELHLPPAFLGLTVLAWGNSVGDFFANTAVAKQGYGTMALAGCYGGPVFNILIGFGSSLLYATIQAYTLDHRHYFPVELDASSWVSLVFIMVALSSTIGIVMWRNYRMDRLFGIYLLMLYALYSVVQAILVMIERSK